MSTVQQAAISYFGLPEGATLVQGGPIGHFAFVIPLTEEHLRGIADRMKALSEPVPQQERGEMITPPLSQEELRGIWNAMPAKEQGIYGSFGVFARRASNDDGMATDHKGGYVDIDEHEEELARLNSVIDRAYELADALYNRAYRDARKEKDQDARAVTEWQDVVDAIQRSGVFARRATTDMPGVWIPLGECNHAQQAADPPAKRDQGEYFLLINTDMLTEEQRIKYVGGA